MSLLKLPHGKRFGAIVIAVFLVITLPISASLIMEANAQVTHEIKIAGLAFVPESLTINVGDTVIWNNTDPVIHTLWFVHVANGSTYLLSDPIPPDTTWTYTFNETVELQYYSFHKLWITGSLMVGAVKYCDVAVTGFTTSPLIPGFVAMINRSDVVFMYDPMPMSVTVKRLDSEPFSADFAVRIKKKDSYSYETVIDTKTVNMAGGDTKTVDFIWSETLPIGEVYTLKAEVLVASPYVVDIDLSNNVMEGSSTQVVWWPDCNGPVEGIWAEWSSVGDDTIDGKDQRALMRAWPPALYRTVCDYDANSVIDGKDLKVLMKYWGKGYP